MKGVKDMLPERKQMILKAIIENYISSAEPVGSKALIGSLDKPLSSATIRNEMSELEEMGPLTLPTAFMSTSLWTVTGWPQGSWKGSGPRWSAE